VTANCVWQRPKAEGAGNTAKVLGAVGNGWQLSGVFTGGSGVPYDARYSYQSNGSNVNLTGSPNYLARIVVNGDPGSGCSNNPYKQFNTAAFSGPTYNSIGNEPGAHLPPGCSLHLMALAARRSIPLPPARTAQFRVALP